MLRAANSSRAAGLLRRAFQLVGDEPARELDDTVYPAFELEAGNDVRPEHAYARGEQLWCFERNQAAGGAGQFSFVGAANPAGSGILSVVTTIVVSSTALNVELYVTETVLTGTANAFLRDSRFTAPGGHSSPAQTLQRFGIAGVIPAGVAVWRYTNTAADRHTDPSGPGALVLAPGRSIFAVATATNVALRAAFSGYERTATRAELGRGV